MFQKQLRKQFAVAQAPEEPAMRLTSIRILSVPRATSRPSPGLCRSRRAQEDTAVPRALHGTFWKTPSFSSERGKTARQHAAPPSARLGSEGEEKVFQETAMWDSSGPIPTSPAAPRATPPPPGSLGSTGRFRSLSQPKWVLKEMQIF